MEIKEKPVYWEKIFDRDWVDKHILNFNKWVDENKKKLIDKRKEKNV